MQNYPSRITLVKYLTVLKISVTQVFKTSHFAPARCSNQNRRTEKKGSIWNEFKDRLPARTSQTNRQDSDTHCSSQVKISSGLSARGGFIFAQYATHLLSPGVNTLTYFALRTKNIHPKRFPVFSCSRANYTWSDQKSWVISVLEVVS